MTRRMRRRLTAELLLLGVLAGVMLGYTIPEVLAKRGGAYSFVDPLVDIRKELLDHYIETPDDTALKRGAIEGMLETLNDPYTAYFPPEQLANFEKQTRGTFSGIGAEISKEGRFITIVSPLEDSPAFKAGLTAGDIILEVEGESIAGVSTQEAVDRITGPQGTPVKLKIRKPDGEEKVVSIVRDRIRIDTVKGLHRDNKGHWNYMLDPDQGVGYIRMTQFSAPTHEALADAIEELQEAGLEALILDLRYNPGGLLDSAVRIADMFLDGGTIVSTRGRGGAEQKVWDAGKKGTLEAFPMVVLINEGSASASEILAGALKYNDRAIVLGTRSVGKGSVQQIVHLPGGDGGLKLTTSLYYMPNGQNIHRKPGAERWGVDPTNGYYVALSPTEQEDMLEARRENGVAESVTNGEAVSPEWIEQKMADPQLAAALTTVRAKLSSGRWKPVGPGEATLMTHLSERRALEERKRRYMERLGEINEELARVQKVIAAADEQGDPEQAEPREHVAPEDAVPAERLPAEAGGETDDRSEAETETEAEPAAP